MHERGGDYFSDVVEKECLFALIDAAKCQYRCSPLRELDLQLRQHNFFIFRLTNSTYDRNSIEILIGPLFEEPCEENGILKIMKILKSEKAKSTSERDKLRGIIRKIILHHYNSKGGDYGLIG